MPLFSTPTPAETNGSDLLDQFEDVLAAHRDNAADRNQVVTERIAALEAELSDLLTLQRKLDAAATA